jgi:outer membrane lipoprotein-sorting protein
VFSYILSGLELKEVKMLKTVLKNVIIVLALTFALSPVAMAAKVKGIAITPEIQAAAERIDAYFNSFNTLKGNIIQTSPKGRASKGVFSILKPGKFRFDVDPPTPYILASDGKWLTITNKKMDRGDQVPLSKTPLRLLAAQNLNLLAESVVLSHSEADGFTTLALADKKGLMPGHIIMVFDDGQNELRQWIIVDGKGQRTTVELSSIEKDVKVNPKLFNITINRDKRN